MAITQKLQFRVDAVTGGSLVVNGDSLSSSKMFNLRNAEIFRKMDEKPKLWVTIKILHRPIILPGACRKRGTSMPKIMIDNVLWPI